MKILLAIDGTKHGDAAAEMVMKMSLGAGDSIHLISVVDMAVPMSIDLYGGYLPDTNELEKTAKENAAKVIAETSSKFAAHFEGKGVAITGDVLFKSSIGRTDLAGGDYNTLINSIEKKLMTLPDNTLVFPGHGPSTTIGEERISTQSNSLTSRILRG